MSDLHPLYPETGRLSTPAFYGMARAELAHNGALHTLLTDPDIGADCLQAIVAHADWPHGIPTGGLKQARTQAPAGGRDRIDELAELDDGSALIIEMKVDSLGGARQLERYMKALAPQYPRVSGLLLRLTCIPDPDPGPRIGRMDLARWCEALAAMTPLVARSPRLDPAHLAEYRALCETMREQERVVVEQPRAVLALASDPSAGGWWSANGRWCLALLAGHLADALRTHDPAPAEAWGDFAWLGPKIDTDNTGGRTAFIDCAVGLGGPFYADRGGPLVEPAGSKPLAVGFLKVRVSPGGLRAEVHVITATYPIGKARPAERQRQRAAMDVLCTRLHAVGLRAGWELRGPPRAGAGSGMALALGDTLLDGTIAEAAKTISARVAALSAALRDTVG